MNIFDKLLTKNYRLLRLFIVLFVLLIIILDELFNYFFFHKPILISISDALVSFILTLILVHVAFYIINLKQKQLNEQLNQLTEAYQYIGQINRKIDSILELGTSSINPAKKNSLHESSAAIFHQLMNVTQAKAGLFYLKPPLHFKIYHGDNMHPEVKHALDFLGEKGIKEFKSSHIGDNEQFFKDQGINENLLKRYIFVNKPVYMHDKDVGHLLLLFNKSQVLEDRDLNIIRIYSFYLALNYTFKPDLSLYENQLE